MESKLIYHMGQVKAHFAYNRKRIFYPTRVKVLLSALDSKCFVKSSVHLNWQNLNQQILLHKQQLDGAILKDLHVNGTIDIDRIKLILLESTTPRDDQSIQTQNKSEFLLSSALRLFIANHSNIGSTSVKQYNTLYQLVVGDDQLCKNIDAQYLHSLLNQSRSNVNANTAYTRYKTFKRFVTWCHSQGYITLIIDWKQFTKPSFKADFIFLSEERIEQLIKLNTSSFFLTKVRHILLILIYTGMRYSDYISLTRDEVRDGYIDKVAQKTKVRFKVPVHEIINEIVKSPPKMSSQTFNRGVKLLGKKLNWNEIVRFRTDINQFTMIPFYEMLCSSVGRHTFATRALLSGVPHNVIMGWCGWTNSAMLFYYSEKMQLQTIDWMNKIK